MQQRSIGDLFIRISANAQPALVALDNVGHGLEKVQRAAHSTEGTLGALASSSESSFSRFAGSVLKVVTAYRLAKFAADAYSASAKVSAGINPVTEKAFSPRTAAVIAGMTAQLSRFGPVGKTAANMVGAAFAQMGVVIQRVGKILAAFLALTVTVKAAIAGFAAAVAVTVAGIAGAFKSAQLKESIGAVEAIFKDSSKSVLEFADTVQASFGRSKKDILDSATQIGAILKSQGFSEAEAAANSITLMGTAMELAAQRGTTTAQALNAVSAAIRGEADPIERLGISINEALVKKTIEADANLRRLAQSNDLTAKAAARLILIQRQSADAFGTMDKEAGNLTQQLEKFKGIVSQTFTDLGSGFEPLVTAVLRLANAFGQLGGGGVTSFASAVEAMLSPLTAFVNLLASAVEGLNALVGLAGKAPKLGGEIKVPQAQAANPELEAFEAAQKKFEAEKEYQERLDGLLSEMAEREKKRQEGIAKARQRQFDEYQAAVQQQDQLFARRESIARNMQRTEILSSAADVFARNIGSSVEDDQLKELEEINSGIKELAGITGLQ